MKKINRRQFIKRGILGLGGMGLGAYALHRYLDVPMSSRSTKVNTLSNNTFSKEAYFYTENNGFIHCELCPHDCHLGSGSRGICRTRISTDHKLYTVAYGNPCAVHNDPIEKKPLYHFLPGSLSFSIATGGCNLRCKGCQNWSISQSNPEDLEYTELFPAAVVASAIREKSDSIAYTYSEPSIFYEYMVDTCKIAKESNLKNVWVTAGYINEKPLRQLCHVIDAANIDLKGFTEQFYQSFCSGRLDPVLRSIKILHEEGVWFEVTNLITHTLNDNVATYTKMMKWLYKNIGPDYPIHISRAYPHHKLTHIPPTPIETLIEFRKIALAEGMHYVYIGNIPDHLNPGKDTLCPNDGSICIERLGYHIRLLNITSDGHCKQCGYKLAGIWEK